MIEYYYGGIALLALLYGMTMKHAIDIIIGKDTVCV